jgi:hypothetical protein
MKELTKEQWFEVACIIDSGFIGNYDLFNTYTDPASVTTLWLDKGISTGILVEDVGAHKIVKSRPREDAQWELIDQLSHLKIIDYISSIEGPEAMPPAPSVSSPTMQVKKAILIDMYLALLAAQENLQKIHRDREQSADESKEERWIDKGYNAEGEKLRELIKYCELNGIAPF